MKRIRLDSKNLTLCFSLDEDQPRYLYFGKKLGKNATFARFYDKETSFFGVDLHRPIFSCFGSYEHHEYSHVFLNANGGYSNSFKFIEFYETTKVIPGMPSGHNEDRTICFTFVDQEAKIKLDIYYSVYFESDVFSCYSKITNLGTDDIHVLKASSLSFRVNQNDFKIVTFNGSWAKERNRTETSLSNGLLINSSVNGSSSHLHNPFTMMIDSKNHAYGFNLIYSGNHKTSYEAGFANRMNVIVGINDFLFDWKLSFKEEFVTPEAIFSYAENENDLMYHFHSFIRNNLMQKQFKDSVRPVIFNNWEGTYFDFTSDKIYEMAKEAKELGCELFVLDDGWFSNRHSDESSLGDWWANKEKTGGSLSVLSQRIKGLGLKFGIWMEPEMISPDSDLYRNHPEYAMEIPGRKPTLWRNELMLDLTQEEVKEFVYKTICQIIDEANADYVKWDYNRQMTEIFGRNFSTSEYFHRYILALYDILERISKKYPHVLFEGCAGGGGRFDLGMLRYFSQIWTSDDTDPRERIIIQDGTLSGYPQIAITAHVSASPIHTTKKTANLKDRYNVSCSMNLGYELDSTLLNTKEKEAIKKQIEFYKQNRELIQLGRTYRLSYKDVMKGVLTEKDNKYLIFIYLLKDKDFTVKLPHIFIDDKRYSIDGIHVSGYDLNRKGLPKTVISDMVIDNDFTVEITSKVLKIE